MSQPDPERPVKKYNPVLFSRRETQEFPSSLKHAGSGASLIHNVHSGAAKRDEDPPEDRPERPRRSFWRRCCALCCGRSSDSDYNDEVLVDTERGSRTDIAHLPPQLPHHEGKKTLVLDLDETLVHSSFKEVDNFDIKLSVEIEDETVEVFVLVRPGTEELLRRLAKHYEIVVYTASLAKYADPLLDQLDKHGVISARLFREHCAFHSGSYVKDLASLGRSLRHTLIVDNSPASYMFQPGNAIPCTNFINDKSDSELYDIIEFCERIRDASHVGPECLKYKHVWRQKYNNGRPHGLHS